MTGSSRWSLARRPFLGALATVPLINRVSASRGVRRRVAVDRTDSMVTIGNDRIEVTVREDNGGIHQVQAVDLDVSLRHPVAEREAAHWRITFYSDDHDELRADSFNAPAPTIETTTGDDRAEVRLEWTGAELVSSADGVVGRFDGTVVSRIVVEAGSPLAQWQFDVRNDGGRAISSVACPVVNGIGPLEPDGTDELVVPNGIGMRSRNPTETGPLGTSYPSGSGTMQFTAYTGGSGGFYADARDTEGHAKRLGWVGGDALGGTPTIGYRMQHYAPRQPGADVSIPYPVSVGAIDGDWHDAADRYRDWLLDEGWLSPDDAGLPAWIRDRGAFFELTSYTRSNYPDPLPELSFEEVVALLSEFADYLDAPLELRWRGWQTHGRKHGLDWFPPKEGADAFEDAIAELSEKDVAVLGYLSGTTIFTYSDIWRENQARSKDWLVRAEDGSFVEFGYGHDHPEENVLYRVEFPQEGYKDALRQRIEQFARAGGSGHNLDGFPWQWVPECYADAHDHPPGFGGNWYARHSRRALRDLDLAAQAERPGYLMSGEGLSDFYLPHLSVAYYRAAAPERHLEVPETEDVDLVPVLPYALGEFHAIRAATIFLRGAPDYQRLAIGRSLVWGCIPVVTMEPIIEDPDDDLPVLDYLGRAARARSKYANRFVGRGRMLRRPDVETDVITMETPTVEPGETTATAWTPAVLTSAWASSAGETGFLLANVSPDGPETVEIDLRDQLAPLPEGPWLLYTVRNGDYGLPPTEGDETARVTVELEPWDVVLLVVAPADEDRIRAVRTIVDAQDVASPDEAELVERAKRRFEVNDLDEAINTARTVIDSDDGGQSEPGSTVTDAPGFTVATGVAGIAAAVASLLKRGGREED